MLHLAPYLEQRATWPSIGRHILAQYVREQSPGGRWRANRMRGNLGARVLSGTREAASA